jgi:ribosomal protein S18 acetylase RimI-like enzyme
VGRGVRPRPRGRPPAAHEIEEHARASGVRTLRLETNRALGEAIALYRSAGFREVPAFNDEPFADHWFEKRVPPAPPQ